MACIAFSGSAFASNEVVSNELFISEIEDGIVLCKIKVTVRDENGDIVDTYYRSIFVSDTAAGDFACAAAAYKFRDEIANQHNLTPSK